MSAIAKLKTVDVDVVDPLDESPDNTAEPKSDAKWIVRNYRVFKGDAWTTVTFRGADRFEPMPVHKPIDPSRVFAVDTESLKKGGTAEKQYVDGTLKTLLVPMWFGLEATSTNLETPKGVGMFEKIAEQIIARYGVDLPRKSELAQRSKGKRKVCKLHAAEGLKRCRCKRNTSGRDGRRVSIAPCVAVFFNLEYDVTRCLADKRALLKSLTAGADAYPVRISERWSIEVCQLVWGVSAHFEWLLFDHEKRKVARVIGLDLTGYWKTSLAEAAKSLGVTEKVDVESRLGSDVYSRPFERFTAEEWRIFRDEYASGDVRTTLDLYHETVKLLTQIDERVVRRTGVIPPSAPGAAIKITAALAFDGPSWFHPAGCHPELLKGNGGPGYWMRWPAKAEQLGCLAYRGGRSFCARPGIYTNEPDTMNLLAAGVFGPRSKVRSLGSGFTVLDLVKAYGFELACLPDPVATEPRYVYRMEGFDHRQWAGVDGVLVVDGESFDDVYPPFRQHDLLHGGRLQYVAGKFTKQPITIAEIVIGCESGRLRIDRVHRGVWVAEAEGVDPMTGDAHYKRPSEPERSFFRAAMRLFAAVAAGRMTGGVQVTDALVEMAKLLGNSVYGKLIEATATVALIEAAYSVNMACFTDHAQVAASIARIYAELGATSAEAEGVYWGVGDEAQAKAREKYTRAIAAKKAEYTRKRKLLSDEERAGIAVVAYVQSLEASGAPHQQVVGADGQLTAKRTDLERFMREHRKWRVGHYFMPLLGAIITGKVAAKLGLMARLLGAYQGDTDSTHIPHPRPDQLPGFARFYEILDACGYRAPRIVGADGQPRAFWKIRDGKDGSKLAPGERWVGTIEGLEAYGAWGFEAPKGWKSAEVPVSVETILVRPKCYSHVFIEPGTGRRFHKQAQHGFTRFSTKEVEDLLREMFEGVRYSTLEDAAKRILLAEKRAEKAEAEAVSVPASVAASAASAPSREERIAVGRSLRAEALHRAFRELLLDGETHFDPRPAPRRLREANRSGLEGGEFFSRGGDEGVTSKLTHDTNTWIDEDGFVRWKHLPQFPAIRRARALTPAQQQALAREQARAEQEVVEAWMKEAAAQ